VKKVLYALTLLLTFILTGCDVNDELALTKKELAEANKKLAFIQETRNIRDMLDLESYTILLQLQKGNIKYLVNKTTENITIKENTLISKHLEFQLPKDPLVIRQRTYIVDDKITKYHSIYEIMNNKENERLETVNFFFVKVKDEWLLDNLAIDE
jgi:hypothetical protein